MGFIHKQNNLKRSKQKRLSRKKKKHWRKNIDLTDVEEALEDQRLELRTGGIISKRKNEELFILGLSDDFSVKKNVDNRLSVDKVIVPNPNAVKPPKPQSKIDANFQKLKRKRQLKRLQDKLNINKPIKNKLKAEYDIWKKTADDLKQQVFHKSNVKCFTEITMKSVSKKVPDGIGKSDFNKFAVEVAHPGASYNPAFNDHQELLCREDKKEIDRQDDFKKIQQKLVVDPKDIVTAEIAFSELQEGLFDHDSLKETGNDDDNNTSDNDNFENLKPFKLKSKRQNQHERQLERQRQKKAFRKKRNIELNSLKELVSKIEQNKAKRQNKKRMNSTASSKQPRISAAKYAESDHVIKLSNEIEGSLRKLRPEGSVMMDRFKSFQKRCFIEPKVKLKPNKSKLKKYKMYEKQSFRRITL